MNVLKKNARAGVPATHPRQTGAVFVEFLLVLLLVLLPMIYLTVEVSRAISQYKGLVNQVRASARYLSTKNSGQGHEAAICFLKTGAISCNVNTPLILPGYANLNVEITDSRLQSLNGVPVTGADPASTHRLQQTSTPTDQFGGAVNLVTVRISGYQYTVISGTLSGLTTINFGSISVTMRQVSG